MSVMSYLLRLYYTLRPLKGRQWWYRLAQPALKKCSRRCSVSPGAIAFAMTRSNVSLMRLEVGRSYMSSPESFCFLHIKAAFPQGIDWNYPAHGALWAFNLNYFEWLYDDTLSVADRLQTIHSYVQAGERLRIGLQGYPAALRIVAWTRFLLRYGVKDKAVFGMLYQHADWLCRFPEYHLDGNHLWEGAIALVCAGLFFRNKIFYKKGKVILEDCLREQLFEDGGHVEGSPMYHSLLLWRLLQCIEMMRAIQEEKDEFLPCLEQSAEKMLGWLSAVTFSDGSWPAINDCTGGVAPCTGELVDFARHLQLNGNDRPLHDSQYRMIREGPVELFIDAADIHPAYQPGHAHADAGTFCLHVKGTPVIVDTGISTYDANAVRLWQRGTAAHNTICTAGGDSSDIWKSFRVGRRAGVTGLNEYDHTISLKYKDFRQRAYERSFLWNGNGVIITDCFKYNGANDFVLHLHFHPDITLEQTGAFTFSAGMVNIQLEGAKNAHILHYNYAAGFNYLRSAQCIQAAAFGNIFVTDIRIT